METPDKSDESTPKNTNRRQTEESWGYDLYPERKGVYKPNVREIFFGEGREGLDRMKCERNVYDCIKNSKLVKLMYGALKASGCPIDIRRHISCEVCAPQVTGGYDPKLNQIVVCQNRATKKGLVQGVLTHEMVHMFDFCRHNLDFENLEHLACTEIRAANLTYCSFVGSVFHGLINPFYIKQQHQVCVKEKAALSIMAVRNITPEEARAVVDHVFSRCYADLEPVGRRIKLNSSDIDLAYSEAYYYGYV